jgi:hypothetical protein
MRSKATWLVLAAVAVVVTAGVVDAVRRSSSHGESAHGNVVTIDGLTLTTPSGRATTEPVATTEAVAATQAVASTQAVATTAPSTQSIPTGRLPSCATEQLRLTLTVGEDLAAAVLRRVKGKPCHHGRAPIGFTVQDQFGDRVAVFGGTQTIQPADFSNGFEQLLDIPVLSCDPDGSFLVIATVGPYVARRTLPGAKLPCHHHL